MPPHVCTSLKVKPDGAKMLYGSVARELHRATPGEAGRRPHFHVASWTDKKHSWDKVAKHSREV